MANPGLNNLPKTTFAIFGVDLKLIVLRMKLLHANDDRLRLFAKEAYELGVVELPTLKPEEGVSCLSSAHKADRAQRRLFFLGQETNSESLGRC